MWKANTTQKRSNASSMTKAQKLNVEWNKIVSDDGNTVIYSPIFKSGYNMYDYEIDVKKFGHDTMNEVAESYFKSKEPGRGNGGRSGIGSRSVGYGIGGEDDEYDTGTIGGVFSAVASAGSFLNNPSSISLICHRFGLNEIEYETISRLYKSITGDKYTLSLHTLNSVTSVVSFSNGLAAVNSLLSKLSAILPTSPLYE